MIGLLTYGLLHIERIDIDLTILEMQHTAQRVEGTSLHAAIACPQRCIDCWVAQPAAERGLDIRLSHGLYRRIREPGKEAKIHVLRRKCTLDGTIQRRVARLDQRLVESHRALQAENSDLSLLSLQLIDVEHVVQ